MDLFETIIEQLKNYLWGVPTLILLLGTHIFLTMRLGFIQKFTFKGIKLSIQKNPDSEGDVSQFGALATSLAATLGTGNIIGVSTAVALGGPGAVFWCWITGVFGIATKYAEGLLAVKYRKQLPDGSYIGGPMYTLEKGLKSKFLAVLFCIFTIISSFGIGSMVQANAISSSLTSTFSFSPIIIGIVVSVLVGVVIIGGIKNIATICEKLIPFMALFFLCGNFIILFLNRQYLLKALALIITNAFDFRAASSGFLGSAIMLAAKNGIARGLFSNESGMGSAPIAAASAKTPDSVNQALVSMTGTFWDTVVLCFITGLVIVSSMLHFPSLYKNAPIDAYTKLAFSNLPFNSSFFLSISIVVFAFSTILGWCFYGERCIQYLFGEKLVNFYRITYLVSIFIGSITSVQLVFSFADCANILMAVPNILSLLLLHKVIVSETKQYLPLYKSGTNKVKKSR
ncbi:MAG: sodium:alanine symporter family protein [Lachnospiraceae bacterium]|nr:sodium:alanine symporter family protein [Lachnospiraceae bacterium]